MVFSVKLSNKSIIDIIITCIFNSKTPLLILITPKDSLVIESYNMVHQRIIFFIFVFADLTDTQVQESGVFEVESYEKLFVIFDIEGKISEIIALDIIYHQDRSNLLDKLFFIKDKVARSHTHELPLVKLIENFLWYVFVETSEILLSTGISNIKQSFFAINKSIQ